MMQRHLFVEPGKSHTGNTFLSKQYTLRCCNRDFRQETGLNLNNDAPPELDSNKVPGKIAPLRTFDNIYGHWVNEPSDDPPKPGKVIKVAPMTRVFPITAHKGVIEFIEFIERHLKATIYSEFLWDLHGTVLIRLKDALLNRRGQHNTDFLKVCSSQIPYLESPISVHPPQAYLESDNRGTNVMSVFGIPSQSTVVTGPHGGLHNNTSVEMGFEEPEGIKDPVKRTYDRKYIGFLCAGHTAHSSDAGKSRRVCSYTRVRVISRDILRKLKSDCASISSIGKWIVYCMGSTFKTDVDGITLLVASMNQQLSTYYRNQFTNTMTQNMMAPPTYYLDRSSEILCISIASGVILRSVPGDTMLDSHMLHKQSPNEIVQHPSLPSNGPISVPYKYSPFFMMAPFVEHDRPPRTLFASGQTTQGVFFPWSPATARVAPLHASKPLVATQFVRHMEQDHETNDDAIWDLFPGEDMTVCYMNMDLNYDDSMVVSSRFTDNGGFSTLSVCTYRIQETENIPEVGELMCGKKYKWWKMECTHICQCKRKNVSHKSPISVGRIPTGIVREIDRTADGHISIKILSFAQLLTGDKISTMHGQKGIARIVPIEDLPMIVMKDGSSFNADIYIAVGSIVSRQTNGQIYESGVALNAAKTGNMYTTGSGVPTETEECDYIMDSTTGELIMRQLSSGVVEPIRATVGITRLLNQTQMTRERHHLTHRSEGKHSLGTAPGRAQGGGVAISEMDLHAMYSSGLYGCAQELYDRGNVCKVPVCTVCKAIESVHDCGEDGQTVLVNMSSDVVIFDQISACINGSCNRYDVEHI